MVKNKGKNEATPTGHFINYTLLVLDWTPFWDDFSFVAWCINLLEEVIIRWVHFRHKRIDVVSNNTQIGCGAWMMLNLF